MLLTEKPSKQDAKRLEKDIESLASKATVDLVCGLLSLPRILWKQHSNNQIAVV